MPAFPWFFSPCAVRLEWLHLCGDKNSCVRASGTCSDTTHTQTPHAYLSMLWKGWQSYGLGGVWKGYGVMLGSSSSEGGVTVHSMFPGPYRAHASQSSALYQETLCRGLAICAWPSASTWPTAVHLSHRLLCPDLQLQHQPYINSSSGR